MTKFHSFFFIWITAGFVLTSLSGCDSLSVKKSISEEEFSLRNQNDQEVVFPEDYLGKVMLLGYVYTHCPDICPAITYNMRDVQERVDDSANFQLISISFDPERDTPEILKDYATNYRLNTENWSLLTGEKNEVDSALELLEISTLKTPTRFLDNGKAIYFIDHTDRVTLIDREGNIRKLYTGSEFN
ncbi:MAG: SCO family protein, partial [Balneolaceae bacterium]|nr:SCO family protein [Balneolaceae bacterium]